MSLFRKIADIGYDKDLAKFKQRSIRLTNTSAVIGAICLVLLAINFLLYDLKTFLPIILFIFAAAVMAASVLMLNKAKKYQAASVAVNILISAPIFVNLLLFYGYYTGYNYLFILLALLPVITIYNRSRWLIAALSSMDLMFFVLLFGQPVFDIRREYSDDILTGIEIITAMVCLVTLVFVFYIYQQILNTSETELEEKTRKLSTALEEVHKLATVDGLTGIFNRRHIEEQAIREFTISDRYKTPLSMVMFDLDHFKKVNDNYGHDVGDMVLHHTALLAAGMIRGIDLIGRWGGEEFIIVLPQTGLKNASELAERLRKRIDDTYYDTAGHVTCSFGVAERSISESFDDFYKRLDKALYNAKNKGRNVVSTDEDYEGMSRLSFNLEWHDSWNSGNVRIDQQHRTLIDFANRFVQLAQKEYADEETSKLMDRISDHLKEHMGYEEKILEKIQFPELTEHRQIHRKISDDFNKLRAEWAKDSAKNASISMFSFIIDKIVLGHILDDDIKFFSFIKEEQ